MTHPHVLIARVELGTTKAGRSVAHLFSANTALQYPALTLFNLAMLENVGINPQNLAEGVPIHRQFRAFYCESDKLNGKGNAYNDIVDLQPLKTPMSDDMIEMLGLVRAIAEHLGIDVAPDTPPEQPAPPQVATDPTTGEIRPDPALRYTDGSTVSDNAAEMDAFLAFATSGTKPANVDTLRAWVKAQN